MLNSEKASIRKAALYCGIPMIILSVFMQLWAYPYLIIMQFLGYTQERAIEIVSDPALSQLLQIVLSSLLFILPFSIALLISGKKFRNTVPLYAPQKQLWLPFMLIGMGVCSFSNIGVNIVSNITSSIFEYFGFEYNLYYGDDPEGIFGFFLCVIATAVVPAMVEEFACRGVLHGFLAKFGEGFAIVATAILFGLMHGNFRQIPFAFVIGLVLGFVRVKTGTLWICVAIHFLNNFVSVLLSWLPDSMPLAVQNIIYLVYLAASMLCTAIGFMLLKKFDTDFLKLKRPESICTEKQKYKWFFTSAAIIIFTVISLLQALSFFE